MRESWLSGMVSWWKFKKTDSPPFDPDAFISRGRGRKIRCFRARRSVKLRRKAQRLARRRNRK